MNPINLYQKVVYSAVSRSSKSKGSVPQSRSLTPATAIHSVLLDGRFIHARYVEGFGESKTNCYPSSSADFEESANMAVLGRFNLPGARCERFTELLLG